MRNHYGHKCPIKGNKSPNREQSYVGQNWEIKTWRINLTSQIGEGGWI